jgi:hypothetical protein
MRASSGARLNNSFGERVEDGAGDLGLHNAVHADPIGRGEGGHFIEDMALQGVPADDDEEGFMLVAVEGRSDVEQKRDEQPNVLHGHGLGV